MRFVSFFENTEFQRIVLKNNKVIVLRNDLEYYENISYGLIFTDYLSVEKNIYNYIKDHPDELVFGITGLYGYWSIKNNHFYKLKSGVFKKIKLKDAGRYFYLYGEEYIKDISLNKPIFGYRYKECGKSEKIENVFVKLRKD